MGLTKQLRPEDIDLTKEYKVKKYADIAKEGIKQPYGFKLKDGMFFHQEMEEYCGTEIPLSVLKKLKNGNQSARAILKDSTGEWEWSICMIEPKRYQRPKKVKINSRPKKVREDIIEKTKRT